MFILFRWRHKFGLVRFHGWRQNNVRDGSVLAPLGVRCWGVFGTKGPNVVVGIGRGSESLKTACPLPAPRPPPPPRSQEVNNSTITEAAATGVPAEKGRRQRTSSGFRCICVTSLIYCFKQLSRSTSRRDNPIVCSRRARRGKVSYALSLSNFSSPCFVN